MFIQKQNTLTKKKMMMSSWKEINHQTKETVNHSQEKKGKKSDRNRMRGIEKNRQIPKKIKQTTIQRIKYLKIIKPSAIQKKKRHTTAVQSLVETSSECLSGKHVIL